MMMNGFKLNQKILQWLFLGLTSMTSTASAHESNPLGYGKTFAEANSAETIQVSPETRDYTLIQQQIMAALFRSRQIGQRLSQYDALLDEGQAYLENGQDNQALAAFAQAQRLIPFVPESYFWIAKAMVAKKNYQHAEKFVLHFISEVASDKASAGWHLLGRTYAKLENKELMKAAYKNAFKLKGNHSVAYWLSGANDLAEFNEHALALDWVNLGFTQHPTALVFLERKVQLLLTLDQWQYAYLLSWNWLSRDINSQRAWQVLIEVQNVNKPLGGLKQDSLAQIQNLNTSTLSGTY